MLEMRFSTRMWRCAIGTSSWHGRKIKPDYMIKGISLIVRKWHLGMVSWHCKTPWWEISIYRPMILYIHINNILEIVELAWQTLIEHFEWIIFDGVFYVINIVAYDFAINMRGSSLRKDCLESVTILFDNHRYEFLYSLLRKIKPDVGFRCSILIKYTW